MNPKIPYPKGNFLKMIRSFSLFCWGGYTPSHAEGYRPCTSASILAISLVNRWSRAPDPWFFGICFWRGPKRRKHRRAKQSPTQSKPNYTNPNQHNNTAQTKPSQRDVLFSIVFFFCDAFFKQEISGMGLVRFQPYGSVCTGTCCT